MDIHMWTICSLVVPREQNSLVEFVHCLCKGGMTILLRSCLHHGKSAFFLLSRGRTGPLERDWVVWNPLWVSSCPRASPEHSCPWTLPDFRQKNRSGLRSCLGTILSIRGSCWAPYVLGDRFVLFSSRKSPFYSGSVFAGSSFSQPLKGQQQGFPGQGVKTPPFTNLYCNLLKQQTQM